MSASPSVHLIEKFPQGLKDLQEIKVYLEMW